jgi:rhodanese-related sulfurtransferase
MLGTLQAQLALSLLLGIVPTVAGRLVTVELHRLHFGGFSFVGASEPSARWSRFIDVTALEDRDVIIDLRDEQEAPVTVVASAIRAAPETLAQADPPLPRERRIVLCCRTGLRAWRAARSLARLGYDELALVALGP